MYSRGIPKPSYVTNGRQSFEKFGETKSKRSIKGTHQYRARKKHFSCGLGEWLIIIIVIIITIIIIIIIIIADIF